jgi:hypothetical protein
MAFKYLCTYTFKSRFPIFQYIIQKISTNTYFWDTFNAKEFRTGELAPCLGITPQLQVSQFLSTLQIPKVKWIVGSKSPEPNGEDFQGPELIQLRRVAKEVRGKFLSSRDIDLEGLELILLLNKSLPD